MSQLVFKHTLMETFLLLFRSNLKQNTSSIKKSINNSNQIPNKTISIKKICKIKIEWFFILTYKSEIVCVFVCRVKTFER